MSHNDGGSIHDNKVSGEGGMIDVFFAAEMTMSKTFVDETAAVEKSVVGTCVRALLQARHVTLSNHCPITRPDSTGPKCLTYRYKTVSIDIHTSF